MAANAVNSMDEINTTEQMPNHTTIIPNVLAAIVFFSPCALFLAFKLYVISAVYTFVIIFLLVSSISNLKWRDEINKTFN